MLAAFAALDFELIYTVSPKTPQHFRLWLENQLSDYDNFWCEYSWHNLPSNDCSVSHLT